MAELADLIDTVCTPEEMRVDARTDWRQAKELVVASYRRVALKRMVAALDGHGRAT